VSRISAVADFPTAVEVSSATGVSNVPMAVPVVVASLLFVGFSTVVASLLLLSSLLLIVYIQLLVILLLLSPCSCWCCKTF
jgi:hypothetical protein